MPRLLLFSNEPILAKGITSVISGLAEFDLIGTCDNPAQLPDLVVLTRPEVLLVQLTGEVTTELLSLMHSRLPACGIVLWAHSVSPEMGARSMTLGARGVLLTTASIEKLIQCLQKVAAGGYWFDESQMAVRADTKGNLTDRELQLIDLVCRGLRNKQIAAALCISQGTLKTYLSRLFRKLGVKDRYELALCGLSLQATLHRPGVRTAGAAAASFVSLGRAD